MSSTVRPVHHAWYRMLPFWLVTVLLYFFVGKWMPLPEVVNLIVFNSIICTLLAFFCGFSMDFRWAYAPVSALLFLPVLMIAYNLKYWWFVLLYLVLAFVGNTLGAFVYRRYHRPYPQKKNR